MARRARFGRWASIPYASKSRRTQSRSSTRSSRKTGGANFSLADNGSLVYVAGTNDALRTLVWVDRDGREEAVGADPLPYDNPRVSPDGTRLAVEVDDPQNADLHVYDLERGTLTRLTFDPGADTTPLWTPDGRAVLFRSTRDGGGLFRKAADGTGEVERLTTQANSQVPQSWSPDGNILVFYERTLAGNDIFTMSLEGDPQPEPLLNQPFLEEHPSVSPDGRWIAYTGRGSDRDEIYVRPFPNVDEWRWQVSKSGGSEPLSGPDGRELFYTTERGIIVVPIDADPMFRPGSSDVLFEGDYYFTGGGRHYDIAPDGKRFLMIKPAGRSEARIIVVQNWLEELKRLVPTED